MILIHNVNKRGKVYKGGYVYSLSYRIDIKEEKARYRLENIVLQGSRAKDVITGTATTNTGFYGDISQGMTLETIYERQNKGIMAATKKYQLRGFLHIMDKWEKDLAAALKTSDDW